MSEEKLKGPKKIGRLDKSEQSSRIEITLTDQNTDQKFSFEDKNG